MKWLEMVLTISQISDPIFVAMFFYVFIVGLCDYRIHLISDIETIFA